MEYTLENLHKLIQTISPENIKPAGFTLQKIDNWIVEALKEKECIQLKLMQDIFHIRKEKQLEIYIQNCQLVLIGFADKLTIYSTQVSKKHKAIGLYQDVLYLVESLLTFIETHFTKYFNLDAKIPESYYRVEQNEIKKKVEVATILLNKLNINEQLTEMFLVPLITFINEKKNTSITYRRLIYLKELLNQVKTFTGNDSIKDGTAELISLLLYLNFNDALFFDYYINKINGEAENQTLMTARIEKLSWHIKYINQSHFRPGVALYNEYAHIKDQIISWLMEEIYFLEKKHQLTMSVTMPKQENEKTEPIYTSLSVPQLAFFVKLLVDTGVVHNRNQTELLKTISKTIRTNRNEIISAESLRNKYYNVDKAATDSVKNVIINLLNQVNKQF